MKSVKKLLSIFLIFSMVIIMVPHDVFAAAKRPGKNRIIKVTVSQKKAKTVKVTVKYTKAKNAKEYRLYNVVAKTGWKYWKTVKASQKKKYSNAKKYKLVKKGKKFKVYRKKTTKIYKPLAKSKKLSASFTGKYNTNYKLVVKAFNGKKSGTYSAVKNFKPRRPTPDYAKYETYVFFGSDSRANDESWKSQDGKANTTDTTGTEGTPRSDVIMLLNVNRTKKTINIVSIYRDTALNKDVNSGDAINFQKANKAYADYGPKQACKVLEKNLDIKIKGYAAANFKGVADVIDAIGGVTVSGLTVETTTDYKNKGNDVIDIANNYIDEMNGKYGTEEPHIEHGADKQTLSGLQAVAYARVRYTTGWEMQRTVRQRNVLRQMIAKYKNLGSGEKIKLLTDNSKGIETDLGVLELAKIASAVSSYTVSAKGYPYYKGQAKKITEEEDEGGTSTLIVPCDMVKNVTKLHNQIYAEPWYAANSTVIKYNQGLQNEIKKFNNYTGQVKAWNDKY